MTGIFFALLAAIGLTNPGFFGMMHVEMNENVLHLLIGATGLWFGYGDRLRRPGRLTKSA
jgi:hypothetical protein